MGEDHQQIAQVNVPESYFLNLRDRAPVSDDWHTLGERAQYG